MTDYAHKGLYPALLAVHAELKTLPKNAINPHFKSRYVELDTIVENVDPILTKHGLVWIAKPGRDDQGDPALHYKCVHAESGGSEEGVMPLLLAKADPQGQGSAITYARRYALVTFLNIVADKDDDGEATRAAARGEEPEPEAKPARRSSTKKATADNVIGPDAVAELARLYAATNWKGDASYPDDEHALLRMQLAAVGAGNEGEIVACIKALTVPQAATVREALQEARNS